MMRSSFAVSTMSTKITPGYIRCLDAAVRGMCPAACCGFLEDNEAAMRNLRREAAEAGSRRTS
jgi:hypothetical protein